jgi:hypothetical protein
MRTFLVVLAGAVIAGCSASTGVRFGTSTSSGSGSASGSEGVGAGTTASSSGAGAGAASSSSGAGATNATGTGGSGTSVASSSGTTSSGFGTGGGLVFDGGLPDAGTQVAEVFGNTPDSLYKVDPVTKAVSLVGAFQGCDTVIDLALDKDSNMFVTTFTGFYSVDRTTAACTHIADGTYPNSLSFVPKGTLDPNEEALVGFVGSSYIRIDPTSGAITMVNPNALVAQGYQSSGDVVSVIGGGTYLTVTGGPQDCGDCIIEVDPKTGELVSFIGALGYSAVYGIAYWGGSAYGFDEGGDLFQINLTTGASTLIPIPNAPNPLVWYGAGSTTSAPLISTQ